MSRQKFNALNRKLGITKEEREALGKEAIAVWNKIGIRCLANRSDFRMVRSEVIKIVVAQLRRNRPSVDVKTMTKLIEPYFQYKTYGLHLTVF